MTMLRVALAWLLLCTAATAQVGQIPAWPPAQHFASGGGAYTFVQTKNGNFDSGTPSSLTVTLNSATLPGDGVIVAGMFDAASTATVSATNGTNAISSVAIAVTNSGLGLKTFCLFLPTVVTGSTSVTVTYTGTAPAFGDFFVWTTRGKTLVLDTAPTPATGTGTTPASTASGTLATAADFAIGYASSANRVTAAGAGWTDDGTTSLTSSWGEHQILTASTSLQATFTATNDPWVALIATFK